MGCRPAKATAGYLPDRSSSGAAPRPLASCSSRLALVHARNRLDEDDQLALNRIMQADPDVAQAQSFVHTFRQMLRDQQPDLLLSWLKSVKKSGVAALKSFANGIQQDLAAVTNALSSPWSNGQRPRAKLTD